MTYYIVKGRTIVDNEEIVKEFTREKDAIDYIKKLGAQYGVNAQIVKMDEGCQYEYSYNPNRKKVIKLLEKNNILYELDDYLNIKIIF